MRSFVHLTDHCWDEQDWDEQEVKLSYLHLRSK